MPCGMNNRYIPQMLKIVQCHAQVVDVVMEQLLDTIDGFRGGIMGEDHSWV